MFCKKRTPYESIQWLDDDDICILNTDSYDGRDMHSRSSISNKIFVV